VSRPDTSGRQVAQTHLLADLAGLAPDLLNDADLLRGVLIAGASAAAPASVGMPMVPTASGRDRSAVLILVGGHIAAHTFPERGLLLLDVLCDARHDPHRVLDVFSRRLTARDVRVETRTRS